MSTSNYCIIVGDSGVIEVAKPHLAAFNYDWFIFHRAVPLKLVTYSRRAVKHEERGGGTSCFKTQPVSVVI